MFQLRIAWLTPKRLPQPIRDLFIGRVRLTSIECGFPEAFVIEELQKLKERQQSSHAYDLASSLPGKITPITTPCIRRF